MLVTATADIRDVVHRGLVWISMACCTLVSASFVLFATDQLAGASKHQQQELVSAAPASSPRIVLRHPRPEPQPRRFIDGAARALTSPFDTFVNSSNQWAVRGVPTMFALFVYGVGLGYLARYTSGLAE
jgi:hypothetical protein